MAINIKNLIESNRLENTTANGQIVSFPSYFTNDEVFVPMSNDNKDWVQPKHPTDYTLLCGTNCSDEYYTSVLLRDNKNIRDIKYINKDGDISIAKTFVNGFSVAPMVKIGFEEFLNNNFQVTHKILDGKSIHTIDFGVYPQNFAGEDLNQHLTLKYAYGKNKSKRIENARFLKNISFENGKDTPTAEYNDVYQFDEGLFVKVDTQNFNPFIMRNGQITPIMLSDGSKAGNRSAYNWLKIEPISWIILNWSDLPTNINKDGTGKANNLILQTEKAIIGNVAFGSNSKSNFGSMWQNSAIRRYLNGINIQSSQQKDTYAGNETTMSIKGIMFDNGFLDEAFGEVYSMIKQNPLVSKPFPIAKKSTKPKKSWGLKFQELPLSTKEQIQFYIDNKKSFMLHGPSGIGKTRRIEEADPNLVSLVLRNGILPEEIIGKNIYPNNDTTQQGTWVPPAWYANLCQKCKDEPNKNHVLFIDEITNVKPNEQSLVYHLILSNSIGPNYGVLPENCVVVAAGNSKEESEAAYNMPEPLFRRFEGHIYLKPDLQEWLDWGSEEDNIKGHQKVHPIVQQFVGTFGDQVFYSQYDSEEPPKFAIDPRGWEQISNIIYDNDNTIACELIENKVGKEIAITFMNFAKNPPLMLEDILEDNYDKEDIPSTLDGKYALNVSLRKATNEQVKKVREFISKELGSELLAKFDIDWVGNNVDRALIIDSLQKQEKQKAIEQQEKEPQEPTEEKIASDKKIDIDKFWKMSERSAIRAINETQRNTIHQVFKRMGKLTSNNDSCHGECFYNDGTESLYGKFLLIEKDRKCKLYQFYEVDFSKYLSPGENLNNQIEQIREKIKHQELEK